jgi:hypothetical protein
MSELKFTNRYTPSEPAKTLPELIRHHLQVDYGGRLESLDGSHEKLIDAFERLLKTLHARGALDHGDVYEIVTGYSRPPASGVPK